MNAVMYPVFLRKSPVRECWHSGQGYPSVVVLKKPVTYQTFLFLAARMDTVASRQTARLVPTVAAGKAEVQPPEEVSCVFSAVSVSPSVPVASGVAVSGAVVSSPVVGSLVSGSGGSVSGGWVSRYDAMIFTVTSQAGMVKVNVKSSISFTSIVSEIFSPVTVIVSDSRGQYKTSYRILTISPAAADVQSQCKGAYMLSSR